MILRRLGNKKALAARILKYFPPHKIYIEPFFGAGGMYFSKPKAKYNIVNDLDSDVFNLFQLVMNDRDQLAAAFDIVPLHSELMSYWADNLETDPIKKALRFLLLSNFGYMGQSATMRITTNGSNETSKANFPELLEQTFTYLKNTQFMNCDFRKFLKAPSFLQDGRNDEKKTLIYADPPYLDTTDNYESSFKKSDSLDLFESLLSTRCNFCMSEFNHPYILELADKFGLNVHILGERHNMRKKSIEILVTNYTVNQQQLF